ncbi:hypothetical protein TNCV_2967581 [Trichonephila clavipes]|nr:hypothetical protein TNCV_2967581 [Trichonephila clavipes]
MPITRTLATELSWDDELPPDIHAIELMSALLAARLAKEVKKILDHVQPEPFFFWTDSQVTLHGSKVQAIDGNPLCSELGFANPIPSPILPRDSTVPARTTQQRSTY